MLLVEQMNAYSVSAIHPHAKTARALRHAAICGRAGAGDFGDALRPLRPAPEELKHKQEACAFVDATFNAATTVGRRVSEVFQRAVDAYAERGFLENGKSTTRAGQQGICRVTTRDADLR